MKAGGPYVLEVRGENGEVSEFTDVLVGDVWLCSGQSNIDVTIERVYPQYVDEIDHFDNDKIRLFRVQNETDTHGPKDDIRPTSINWKPLTKENAWLLHASVTYDVTRNISLWVRGENLLAQKYEINLGYPMPRATFMGGVNVQF